MGDINETLNASANATAETILNGQGENISATFIGDAEQNLIFSNANAEAGDVTLADTGAIFSTGAATNFNDGDNVNNGASTTGSPTSGSDADLAALNPGGPALTDASGIIITFDATFTGDLQLALTYVTQEYPTYTNSGFQDPAAIFLEDSSGNFVPISIPDTGTDGYFNPQDFGTESFIDNNTGTSVADQTDFRGVMPNRIVSIPVEEGETYTIKIVVADMSDSAFDSAILVSALCFCAGAMIETETGPQRVEELSIGQRLPTRDHGYQAIRWIGRSQLFGGGYNAPIRIAAGALGNDADLWVSPNHKVLISGWRADLFCSLEEVLVPAKHLVNGTTITQEPCQSVDYYHVLLDSHALIQSNGIWTESFRPGPEALQCLDAKARDDLFAAAPDQAAQIADAQTSLPIGKGFESKLFAATI